MPRKAYSSRPLIPIFAIATLIVLVSETAPSHAEMLPTYSPDWLWMYSDLVVYGEQTGPDTVTVEKVVKGTWPDGKALLVGNLPKYDKFPFAYQVQKKKEPPAWLTNKVCLFLSRRGRVPEVIANGIFRLGSPDKKEVWLGYTQPMNPGFYFLSTDSEVFRTKEQLDAQIKKGPEKLKAEREEKIGLLKKTEDDYRWRRVLDELSEITRWGDSDVSKDLIALQLPDEKRRDFTYFLSAVRDPQSWQLAKQLCEESEFPACLSTLGSLGHPDAAPFLEKTARASENKDRRNTAIVALHRLIERLNELGDRESVPKVTDLLIKLLEDDVVPDILSAQSGLLANIPDPRALELLKKTAEKWKNPVHGMIPQISESLKKCEECLRKAKAAEEVPKNPQKAQENTGSSDTTPTK